MPSRRALAALVLLALLLVPALAWSLAPATLVESPRPDQTLTVDASRPHRSVHEWNVTFGLPMPAPFYDVEPALDVSIQGVGFDAPASGPSLVFTVTVLVNGERAGGDVTTFEGGNAGTRWTAPEEWDPAPLRRGDNVVTFRVEIEGHAGAPGKWQVEMKGARVRVDGWP